MRPLPFDLIDRFTDWRWTAVSSHTYVFDRAGERRYVKLADAGRIVPDEAQKLRWARPYITVPEVVEYGSDGDTDWLMTLALDGIPADPVALGEGLRAFHELMPVRECPFDFTVPTAVAHVRARLAAGSIDDSKAVDQLIETAPQDWAEAVCHGDYRPAHALMLDGRVTGYLGLGRLGIADPWWDLTRCGAALAPGDEQLLYQAYGTSPDHERIAWYRLLYDLS